MKLLKLNTRKITYLGGDIYRLDGIEEVYINPDYIVTIEELHLNIPNNDYDKDKKKLYSLKLITNESITIEEGTLEEIINNTDNNRMTYMSLT